VSLNKNFLEFVLELIELLTQQKPLNCWDCFFVKNLFVFYSIWQLGQRVFFSGSIENNNVPKMQFF